MPFQKNAKERSLFPSPDIFHPATQAELRESRGDESRILSASQRERKRRLYEVPQPTTPSTMTPIVTAAADRISPDSTCSLIEFDGEFDPNRLITCSNDSDFLMG
uniref:Uncharacterized protein n=1 Tax=Plectus sambesii TaxID=2011161 RepID=A0A914WJI4_9BILA